MLLFYQGKQFKLKLTAKYLSRAYQFDENGFCEVYSEDAKILLKESPKTFKRILNKEEAKEVLQAKADEILKRETARREVLRVQEEKKVREELTEQFQEQMKAEIRKELELEFEAKMKAQADIISKSSHANNSEAEKKADVKANVLETPNKKNK